jgi:HD-GYP domain-containing protein (c-di-GMP phosphodiesterase class II)
MDDYTFGLPDLGSAAEAQSELAARLKVLETIGFAIASGGPLEMVLEVLMELLLQAVPSEAATIFMLEQPEQTLRFAVTRGVSKDDLTSLQLRAGDGLVGWAVRHNQHLVITDAQHDARFNREVDQQTGFDTRSALCVPLSSRRGVIGAIQLLNRRTETYTEAEATYVASIGAQVAQVIENMRLFEEQQQAMRVVQALQEAGRWLNSSLDLQRVLDQIVRSAGSVVEAEAGSILLTQLDGRLKFEVAFGPRAEALLASHNDHGQYLDQGVAAWVAQHAQPQLIPDCAADPRFTGGPGARIASQLGFENKSMLCVPMRHREQVVGVFQLINRLDGKPFNEADLHNVSAFADDAAAALTNARLYDSLEQSYIYTIDSLVTALDARDNETGGHSQRVALYALEVAKLLNLPADEQEVIYNGSLLHDIGKIGIPDSILRKPDRLTEEEFSVMRRHTIIGYRILKGISFLEKAAVIPLFHHERYDGKGYLFGLAGHDIPLGARIFAVVDTYDAMTSDRVYRAALSHDTACQELRDCSGTQFDQEIAEAFLSIPGQTLLAVREQVRTQEARNRPLRAEMGTEEEDYAAAEAAYKELKSQGVL